MAHKEKSVGEVHIHNRETEQVSSLIPFQLRDTSSTFIAFLEDYYNYLNQKGQPTNVIDRIQYEHDIDLTDEVYVEYLKKEIAKDIPNSTVLDNRSLLRNIVSFYKSRGAQGSINEFFKLFFDDEIILTYPSEKLFKPSSGDINVFGYSKRDGTKVFYNTTTRALEEAVPTGPTIYTPDYTPSVPGYLKIGSNFENIFWTYGDYGSYTGSDKTFTIRVEKKTPDSGYQSPVNSPEIPTSGFALQTRLNLGDTKLSTNLIHDVAVSPTIDISNSERARDRAPSWARLPYSTGSAQIGGGTTNSFVLDSIDGVPDSNDGEVYVTGTTFTDAVGNIRTGLTPSYITTAYGEGVAGTFYIMYTNTSANTRFEGSDNSPEVSLVHDRFVGIRYNGSNGYEIVDNNPAKQDGDDSPHVNQIIDFQPTDCIVGAVETLSTTGGLGRIYLYSQDSQTYRLGTYDEDAPIYDKNLETGEVTFLQDINSPNEPYAKSFDLTDRHLYFGENNELGAIATGRNHTLLPTRAGGKYFSDVIFGSNGKETIYNFYAFEDTTISFHIDYEQGLDSPIRYTPTLVQKKRIKKGKYATFITNNYASPADQHVVFFSSTGYVAGSTYTTNVGQDMTILSPMSSDYISRGDPNSPTGESTKYLITWDLTDSKIAVDNTTSVRHSITDYSPSTNSFVFGVVHVNDGLQSSPNEDGNDKSQGIPVGYCNDTYLWPDGLTGYTLVSPYADNTINVYQHDSSSDTWDLYQTITPTVNVANQVGSYSGDTSPQDSFIGPNSPASDSVWKFEGTYPFALWVNDNLLDEELVWGWNRTDYNLPIYTQFTTYNDQKGFVSDINKIHDGERFQEFSYVIDTKISFDRWRDGYYKLVHPAGLKLFTDVTIESVHSRTDREILPTWTISDPTWVTSLYTGLGNHTPFYQPGWLDLGGNVDISITADPFNMSINDFDLDQDLLSTIALRYDTSTSDVLSIRLTTSFVEKDLSYALMNIDSSPQEFFATSTFESASNDVVTHSFVSWDSAIDLIDTETLSGFERALEFSGDSPQGTLSSVRAYLGATSAVNEHQLPLTVLERSLLGDVTFPDTDSPLEQSITETFI